MGSLFKPVDIVPQKFEDADRNYFEQYEYGPVLYDKYRDLYYRFLLRPVEFGNAAKTGEFPPPKKTITVLIFGETFRKVDEMELPNDVSYNYMHCFVMKDGLAIKVSSDDDDCMSFKVFKTKDIE